MPADILDRVYATLRRPAPLFSSGWGLPAHWSEITPGLDQLVSPDPPRIEPCFSDGAIDGSFESPVTTLPARVRRARVRWIEPRGRTDAALVMLGSWGDESFALRQRLVAPLVAAGVAVALPETPFFGARRPIGQRGVALSTVYDFLSLGHAAVEEARGLLAWLARRGHQRLGIAGFSMGGQLAALTAALVPWPVSVVTVAASDSPASVFCRGPLGRAPSWRALEADGLGAAAPRLRALFERYAVTALPPPKDPSRAIVIGTERDLVVPPADAERIAAHWRGARLRWLPSGHVGALLLHQSAIRRALGESLALAATAGE